MGKMGLRLFFKGVKLFSFFIILPYKIIFCQIINFIYYFYILLPGQLFYPAYNRRIYTVGEIYENTGNCGRGVIKNFSTYPTPEKIGLPQLVVRFLADYKIW